MPPSSEQQQQQQRASGPPADNVAQGGASTADVPVNAGVPATQSNSGNIHQPPAPQVHVHASQDQDEVEMSRNTPLNMLRTGSPANSALSSHSHPGSSASSPTGHLAASLNQLGTGPGLSPHTGLPVTGTSNASLSAPAPLYHQGQYGSPGSLGESGNQLEGRISPRPVSRNRSRNSHYQDMLFNPDGYDRPPGDTRMQLFVGNLPFRVRWQDLKDLFRKCGSVLRSDVALTLDNRSKGFGTVLYANEEDALNAIQTFDGYTWQSRVLDVRVDQQDPTGSISLANAAAQQAQHHAYQTHQQAMQNMANMVGIAQNAAAAAMYHQGQGYQTFGQGQVPSPWMAAAMANNLRPNLSGPGGYPPHLQAPGQMQGGPGQFMVPGRAASPYKAVQLGNDLANMSLRRNSASTESSSRPSLPQSGSSSSLGLPASRVDNVPSTQASPIETSSRPGTSPASPTLQGVLAAKADSPSPRPGPTEHRDSVSPTSARRPPPGSLGPMPPSIFASMPQNTQLPNPPAAAAAAVAAGYSLDGEATGRSRLTASPYSQASRELGPNGRRGSTPLQDMSIPADHQQHQADASISPPSGPSGGAAQPPLPGGLVNFYQQHRGPPGFAQGSSPYGNANSGRNSPAPAFGERVLFVGNIPFNCQWQDLKDLFRAAGSIVRADIILGTDGRSRGFGRVIYATPEDTINAMQMFNGYEFQGRPLKVHFDKFAPGGLPNNQPPPYNDQQNPVYNVHESHFIQPAGMHAAQPGQSYSQGAQYNAVQPAYAFNQNGQRDWQQGNGGNGMTFDENGSVPGTPIHEMSLAQMAAFPSPGFASPVQQQHNAGQPADLRRRGFNAEGIPVAPIGSGAPHAQHAGRPHMQQGHHIPLSPLTIPPMSMAMPSPGPGGMFSPPLPGMGPMMTPSMPGFSFHPFPQTPPLLPHFLSPGLGPFSPPLFGTPGAFVGHNGPSALRNSAPGDADSTPLQSPNASYAHQQQGNYFPPLPDQPQRSSRASMEATLPDDTAPPAQTEMERPAEAAAAGEDPETTTPTLPQAPTVEAPASDAASADLGSDSHLGVPPPSARRASFKDQKINYLLDVPSSSNNRGGSLDIPRPDLKLGEIASLAGNGSALVDDDVDTPPASSPAADDALNASSESAQTKKSAWNLSWLKKQ